MPDPFFAPLDPYGVQQQEVAQAQERAAPVGFGGLAIQSAHKLGRALGYKSDDERRAMVTQKILADSQTEVTSEDPTEARMELLSAAARRFNDAGMTDYVAQIGPELISLQRKAAELSKLREEAAASIALTAEREAGTAETLASGQNYVKGGKIINVSKQNVAVREALRAAGWAETGLNIEAPSAEGIGGMTNTQRGDEIKAFREQARNIANLSKQIGRAMEIVTAQPGAATLVGPVTQAVSTIKATALAVAGNAGVSSDVLAAEFSDYGKVVTSTLPRASAQLRNSITTLIFAEAKVNDPGGRLSNQDVEAVARQYSTANQQFLVDKLAGMLATASDRLETEREALAVDPTDSAYQTARSSLDGVVGRTVAPAGPKAPRDMTDEELLQTLGR